MLTSCGVLWFRESDVHTYRKYSLAAQTTQLSTPIERNKHYAAEHRAKFLLSFSLVIYTVKYHSKLSKQKENNSFFSGTVLQIDGFRFGSFSFSGGIARSAVKWGCVGREEKEKVSSRM
jgi:hypothetical protein